MPADQKTEQAADATDKIRENRRLKVVCLLGFLVPLLMHVISELSVPHSTDRLFVIAIAVIAILAWLATTWVYSNARRAALFLYVSIPLGVLLDAVVDGALKGADRNLFPIEMVLWGVLAPVPILAGYLLRVRRALRTDVSI